MSALDDEFERIQVYQSVRLAEFTTDHLLDVQAAAKQYPDEFQWPPAPGDITQLRCGDEVCLYQPGLDVFDVVIEERQGDNFVGRIKPPSSGEEIRFHACNILCIFKCGGRDLLEEWEELRRRSKE